MKILLAAAFALATCVSYAGQVEDVKVVKDMDDFSYTTQRGYKDEVRCQRLQSLKARTGLLKTRVKTRLQGAKVRAMGAVESAGETVSEAAGSIKDAIKERHEKNCSFLKRLHEKLRCSKDKPEVKGQGGPATPQKRGLLRKGSI